MTLIEKLKKIEDYVLQHSQYHFYFAKSPFGMALRMQYYYYPEDIPEATKDLGTHFLTQAGYDDFYTPLAELMNKANITPPSPVDMVEGSNWTFFAIKFRFFSPLNPALKKYSNTEYVTFMCIPCQNHEGQDDMELLYTSPTTGNLFKEMGNSQLLDPSSETNQAYLQLLDEAVNFICEKLGIDEPVPISIPEALSELIALLNIHDDEAFQKRYQQIQEAPEKCLLDLVEQGYAEEGDKPELAFLRYRFLLQPMLDSFDTDWRIDNEELSEYLSNIIGKKFKLPQKALEPYEIVERLEKKSDYTLLNIETEQDSYSLFVCKQKDKKRILQLARMLDFAIVPF
ncbi:hypothetical protein SPJ73_00350 [Pasteurella multocida]|uniref:DUF6630 family protein n=1 Tax=Pasteurella multocida TaxID=747 RepID=UPI0028DF642D|nr:hypothetical protein [Pasteurella multocida]HDR1790948.1 hypothetical protein [Pasteurella multocida]HDR1828321.1 hypothetical protein [Pasteurella multocida]HDR1897227.1 hypothetical protein [Pasteurella multocida]HEA3262643.1 hypothetical protein [Pasteurella multocida]